MNSLSSISFPQVVSSGKSSLLSTGSTQETSGFKQALFNSIQKVNSMQTEANASVEQMFTGGDVNTAEVLTAVQKADLAFRLTMQMRNKLMDVYREIKDIRV